MGFARWVVFGLAVQVSCGCSHAAAAEPVESSADGRWNAPTHQMATGSANPREWPHEAGLLLLGLLARKDALAAVRAAMAKRLLGLASDSQRILDSHLTSPVPPASRLNPIDSDATRQVALPLRPSIQPAFSCAMREDGTVFCEGPRAKDESFPQINAK